MKTKSHYFEETAEFIVEWMMEFGDSEVTNHKLYTSKWYMRSPVDVDVSETSARACFGFVAVERKGAGSVRTFRLTPEAVDFLRRYEHDSTD